MAWIGSGSFNKQLQSGEGRQILPGSPGPSTIEASFVPIVKMHLKAEKSPESSKTRC